MELRKELRYKGDFQRLVQLQEQIGLDLGQLERARPKSGKSLISRFGKDTKASEVLSPKSVLVGRKPGVSMKESAAGDSVVIRSGKETTRNQIITKIAGRDEFVNIVSESGDKLNFPKVQIL